VSERAELSSSVGPENPPWYLGTTPLAAVPWLIRLRWTTVSAEAALLVASALLVDFNFPLGRLAPLIALSALMNVLVAVWLTRRGAAPRGLATMGLILDVVLLTALLEITGGPFNPFSVIYLVLVTLAALTLGRLHAAGLALCSAVGYALLVYWHTTEPDPAHHQLTDFPTHLFTMWIAIAATAELAGYFVVQASNALARREQEIEAMREKAARTERLMSLTTLAAGAAHELSTPLATIALASRELERAAAADPSQPGLVEDARLIRTEVDRCRTILDQLSGRVGDFSAGSPEPVPIATVVADLRSRLPAGLAARLSVNFSDGAVPVHLPPAALGQAVFSLVKNAFDATADTQSSVSVDIVQDRDHLRVSVRDQGHGMPADVLKRVGEPFFTTKEPGRGLGLGLFLARVFAERFGGVLSLHSKDGTTASIELPIQPPRRADADTGASRRFSPA
jgi:two-component system sensor histidine kinase RegB